MRTFVIFALAGVFAQMVDGTLGMAYGVTATSVLLAAGTTPALASASVHLAEVGTSLTSGAAHWRFGNVDWPVVTRIALPGAAGAVLGAYALTSLSTEAAAPYMAGLLVVLGGYVLLRFSFRSLAATVPEFVVALAASVGFLFALGSAQISWLTVGGLLAGGVLAAPFAAWLVRVMPARLLGTAAGGLIVLTNLRIVFDAAGVEGGAGLGSYVVLGLAWVLALSAAVRALQTDRAQAADISGTSPATFLRRSRWPSGAETAIRPWGPASRRRFGHTRSAGCTPAPCGAKMFGVRPAPSPVEENAMRVEVDLNTCEGHGQCNAVAPEVYHLDEGGYCLIRNPEVPADLEAAAEEGAMACPIYAITVLR